MCSFLLSLKCIRNTDSAIWAPIFSLQRSNLIFAFIYIHMILIIFNVLLSPQYAMLMFLLTLLYPKSFSSEAMQASLLMTTFDSAKL